MADDSGWGLEPGDALGRGRRVIRRLAGGGAHEAFLVDIGGSRRAVAKLPRPYLANDIHRLVSLADEGRALDRLAHPGVPRRLDTVLASSRPHLLLEHVPGATLRGAIAGRGALDPADVAVPGHRLAVVLNHIAGTGWVHLDVKPSNVVLNVEPRLVDFELARPAADAARLTAPVGTWHYMPPEQRAAGATASRLIGPPADVFALALSLGEALLGRTPERDPSPEPLPGAVGAVLTRALTAWPEDRPTAAEMADSLLLLRVA